MSLGSHHQGGLPGSQLLLAPAKHTILPTTVTLGKKQQILRKKKVFHYIGKREQNLKTILKYYGNK